ADGAWKRAVLGVCDAFEEVGYSPGFGGPLVHVEFEGEPPVEPEPEPAHCVSRDDLGAALEYGGPGGALLPREVHHLGFVRVESDAVGGAPNQEFFHVSRRESSRFFERSPGAQHCRVICIAESTIGVPKAVDRGDVQSEEDWRYR